jgi:hypothetical protein
MAIKNGAKVSKDLKFDREHKKLNGDSIWEEDDVNVKELVGQNKLAAFPFIRSQLNLKLRYLLQRRRKGKQHLKVQHSIKHTKPYGKTILIETSQ